MSDSCIQLRALAAHKDLAWEDSSASKAVLGGARVELAGSLVAEEDRQAPGPQREARFQRPVRETPATLRRVGPEMAKRNRDLGRSRRQRRETGETEEAAAFLRLRRRIITLPFPRES